MKKNRLLVWALIAVLVLVLSACAPPASDVEEPGAEEAAAEEVTVDEPEAEAEEVEEVKEPLKVAFVFGGPLNDYSWNQVWDEGRMAMDEHFGDQVETIAVDLVPWSEESTQIMEQLIADGADVIVETSGYGDFYYSVVEAHPEVIFLSVNPPLHDNEMYYMFEVLKAHYLDGVAAGLLAENGQIGYIAPFPAPYMQLWIGAIEMGAQSVNPDATIHVTFIASYYDPPATRQAAEALADFGVDVLLSYVNVDTAMEVAEERDLWTSGRYHPLGAFAPEKYVTSFLVDSSGLFINEIQAILDGTWTGNEMRYITFEDGGITLDEFGPNVPQDVVDQVNAVYDELAAGFHPLTGPVYDSEGNLVVPDGEEIPEAAHLTGLGDWVFQGVISTD